MKVGFTLNGDPVEWDVHPGETFFEILKTEGHYTKKRGCSTGDCGVCIVLLDGRNVHACQTFPADVADHDVRTYEGTVYRDKKTGEVKTKPGKRKQDS